MFIQVEIKIMQQSNNNVQHVFQYTKKTWSDDNSLHCNLKIWEQSHSWKNAKQKKSRITVMDSSTNVQAPPQAAYFHWSCDKVYHKQEVCFLLYFLGQIVGWQYNPNLLD